MTAEPTEPTDERRAELAHNLAAVRERLARACEAAGRAPGEVELLAVTKYKPASDVAALLDLGLPAFGENRAQEAEEKAREVAELRPGAAVRWEFVGGLQRNKARLVVPWVTRVQSVDSARLATALDREVGKAGRDPLPVLIQYSVDGDPERGGVPDAGLLDLAAQVTGSSGLVLEGLMSVAPLGADPDEAFAAIAAAAGRLRAAHPSATALSAGMSGDLEVAIRHGSTVARVGTALVGDRRLTSR